VKRLVMVVLGCAASVVPQIVLPQSTASGVRDLGAREFTADEVIEALQRVPRNETGRKTRGLRGVEVKPAGGAPAAPDPAALRRLSMQLQFEFDSAALLGASGAQAARYCGPSSSFWLELAIPEYVCFSIEGGTLPSAACAAGAVVGYKPVYFGAACQGHDGCYGTKGEKTSTWYKNFRSLLIQTYDTTLTGGFRKGSRGNCHNVVADYYHQVRAKGCSAYTSARKRAGNKKPVCS